MGKLILSCDTGVDDALAIAYAVGQKELELIGITVSYGMSFIGNTYRNTRYLANLFHTDVPVYMGSAKPIVREGRDYKKHGSRFHGQDGVGNMLGDFLPEDIEGAEEKESVAFIIESIKTYGKELTLVTTGPLTDLARVVKTAPELVESIGSVVVMAGAVASPGNVNPVKEANVAEDPEAAKIVLESKLPLTLVGLDVTRKTLFTFEDLKRWEAMGTKSAEFLCGCMKYYLEAYRAYHPYLNGCALHDPLAVGLALHPEWMTAVPMHITCVTEGELEGRTCEDISRCGEETYDSKVALLVKNKEFESHFFKVVEEVLIQN